MARIPGPEQFARGGLVSSESGAPRNAGAVGAAAQQLGDEVQRAGVTAVKISMDIKAADEKLRASRQGAADDGFWAEYTARTEPRIAEAYAKARGAGLKETDELVASVHGTVLKELEAEGRVPSDGVRKRLETSLSGFRREYGVKAAADSHNADILATKASRATLVDVQSNMVAGDPNKLQSALSTIDSAIPDGPERTRAHKSLISAYLNSDKVPPEQAEKELSTIPDSLMSKDEKSRLSAQIKQRKNMAEAAKLQQDITAGMLDFVAKTTPTLGIDKTNKYQVAAVETSYETALSGNNVLSEHGVAVASEIVKRTGYVPKRVNEAIRQTNISNDPMSIVAGANLYGAVRAANPRVAETIPASQRAFLEQVTDLVGTGADPARAVEIAKKNVMADKTTRELLKTKYAADDVQKNNRSALLGFVDEQFDNKWGGLGVEPNIPIEMEAEFNASVERYYVMNGGDANKARASAFSDIKNVWGVSALRDGELMKYPPEHELSASESADWMKDQFRSDIIKKLKSIDPDDVQIDSDEKTAYGHGYTLFTLDEIGNKVYLTKPDGTEYRWRPDFLQTDNGKKQAETRAKNEKEAAVKQDAILKLGAG